MDANQLKRLAGIPVTESKAAPTQTYRAASSEVLNSAPKAELLKWLGENYKDYGSAMSAVNDFMMVAGRTLPIARRAMLETWKSDIRVMFKEDVALEPFNMSLLRKMAGMAPSSATPVVEKDEEDAAPAGEELPAEEEETPAIIAKIASKAEGKTGDELAALITQVYDAGVNDGKLAAAEEVDPEVKEALATGAVHPNNTKGKSPKDLGGADAYYHRPCVPTYYGFKKGTPEYQEYVDEYDKTKESEGPRGGKQWDESIQTEAVKDSNGKEIKAGSRLIWTDTHGDHTGTVEADPKYNGGLKVGGRSVKNIIDDSNKVIVTEAKKPAPGEALTASVGVDKEDDAGWMAVELAKAGMVVDMEEAMGVFYFNFKNKSDEAKAKKIAAKLQITVV